MGSKMELFRMSLYVFFPVALFYYFNLPDNQDDFIEKRKKELYPPYDQTNHPPTTVEDTRKYREMLIQARKNASGHNLTESK